MDEAPLSAVVVCFNEARRLGQCLDSLDFCDERIVVDLGSQDDSVAIAESRGARVVPHDWVPVIEKVRRFAVNQASSPWVVMLDPDMALPAGFGEVLRREVTGDPSIAAISAVWQDYFMGRPLWFSFWGVRGMGRRMYTLLAHRDRCTFGEEVHCGVRIDPSRRMVELPYRKPYFISHYWVDSIEAFLDKHRRYYAQEGIKGRHPTLAAGVVWLFGGFVWSYLYRLGVLEGRLGLFLSLFWGVYQWNSSAATRWLRRQPAGVRESPPERFEGGIPDRWLLAFYRWLRLPEPPPGSS